MDNFNDKNLIVITPVYEDREASSVLFKELFKEYGEKIYIVAIDDGSVKVPLSKDALIEAGVDGIVIKLKRNVGHQRAISIGINYVAERIKDHQKVIVMDSDGEDTPKSIKELVIELEDENIDVVVAKRKSRVETLKFKLFYEVYKFVFLFLSGKRINFGNFMALKPNAIKRVATMQETWIHIAASVLSSKLRIKTLPLDRGARYAGQSKMNFVGLALHGFKGLMVFAEDVLVRVGIACTLIAVISILLGSAAILLKLFGFATPGWFSVALGILFLVFLQTGALTLMTLMLTGVVKGGAISNIEYKVFISSIEYATDSDNG